MAGLSKGSNNGGLIIQSSAGTASDATLFFRDSQAGTDQWRIAINEDQNNKLYFYDDYNNQFRMVIQQDGNVGIGTASPGARLEITEDGTNPGLRLNYGGGNLFSTIEGPLNRDLRFVLRDNDWPDKFAFRNAAGTELMAIRRDGVVSIGTGGLSIPSGFAYKLAVDGKIICEEVKVKDSGSWPDHVFKADYDLMPLPEVEHYIAKHQHLPDVPSAEEVAADGLSLGESQALLLQKIEELTLYMIDLDKENQALKERVGKLER